MRRNVERARAIGAAMALTIALSAGAARLPAQVKVPIEGSEKWRVRYADSTLTRNDRCPIRDRRLSTMRTPVYVNGRPVGFC